MRVTVEKLYGRCVRLRLLVTVQVSFQMRVHERAVSPGVFILIHVDDPFQISSVFSLGARTIPGSSHGRETYVSDGFLVYCRMFACRLHHWSARSQYL